MLVEFSAQGRFDDWASTVMRNYRFTEYYEETGGVSFREYYDLKDDPWELRNLLGPARFLGDRFSRADDRLASDRSCAGVTCP
jgi:hypothetical protein